MLNKMNQGPDCGPIIKRMISVLSDVNGVVDEMHNLSDTLRGAVIGPVLKNGSEDCKEISTGTLPDHVFALCRLRDELISIKVVLSEVCSELSPCINKT
jgi:hypothetical protein